MASTGFQLVSVTILLLMITFCYHTKSVCSVLVGDRSSSKHARSDV